MAATARQGVAVLYIFLLFSTQPIDAKRHLSSMKTAAALKLNDPHIEAMLVQIKSALAEDEAGTAAASSAANNTHQSRATRLHTNRSSTKGWYCDKLKNDYERRAGKLNRALKEGHELPGGVKSMSWSKQAYAALKSRTVVKTLQDAQWWECEWSMKGEEDKSSLESILKVAASENRCVAKASELLRQSQGKSEHEQQAVLGKALLMMMSSTDSCTPPDASNDAPEDEKSLEKEVDGEAHKLEDKLREAGSFLQTDALATADLASRTAFIALFLMGAVAVITVLLLIIACLGALVIATLVVGLVFCILRSLLYALLWIFMGADPSLGNCVVPLWRWLMPVEKNGNETYKPGMGSRVYGVGCAAAGVAVWFGAIPLGGLATLGR